MSHDPYFLLDQKSGGDYIMSMAYLLSWRGPVLEEEDPYGDGISPEGLKAVCHVQEIQILPEYDRDAIKEACRVPFTQRFRARHRTAVIIRKKTGLIIIPGRSSPTMTW